MDSGNSGSMQSSSGGDEEYDSRGESMSTFLNPSAHFGSNNSPFLTHQPTFFDPHSQNLDAAFPQSANSQYGNSNNNNNNDLIWSRGLRSDINSFNNFGTYSSSSSSSLSLMSSSSAGAQVLLHQSPFPGTGSGQMQMQNIEPGNVGRAELSKSAQPEQPVKNPKKRTRASRRAPTTVLTTDTTNFRQMVQEFTGIPTAPFTGSPYSRRLDLFSTAGSAMRSGHLDGLGPLYPLRPSAHKAQVAPFMPHLSSSSSSTTLLSSSVIDALMPTNSSGVGTTNNASVSASASASASTSTNFQLGDSGIPRQAQNLFNMQSQLLSFKHPLTNVSIFGTKAQGSSSMLPSLDELGIGHEQVSANLSGFPSSGGNITTQPRNDGNFSRLWRGNGHDGNQENQLTSFDGGGSSNNNNGESSSQHVISGYKLNCSASSTSEFHPEKGLENVCSAGDQGPVSSWNCPSE